MSTTARAWIALLGAFLIWGGFPIFVREMASMRADEFLYVRIAFSFVGLLLLYLFRGQLKSVFVNICRPQFLIQALLTAGLIAANWLLYIVAVNWNQTSQASIGYFITPLFNVALGALFFHEKLDRWTIIALCFGAAGVIYQLLVLHIAPWLAVGIGAAFGVYGALRKKFRMPPVQGLFAELLVLMPFVMIAWGWLVATGKSFDYAAQPFMIVMSLLAGVITVVPLLLFLYAVQHLSLTSVGLAQYSSPSIQLLIAIFYFHEPFDIHRLIAFILIWTGLIIYSVHLIYAYRRIRS